MSFFALGTVAVAGSVAAAGGAAAVAAIGVAGAALETSVVTGVMGYESGKNAASVNKATADYNNKYDIAAAEQLDADTLANITTERQNNAVYLSREAASYASAGVLATSGSALHAQIINAGKMEQQIQQQYVNSQQKQASYYSQGKAGVAYGLAQSESDRMSGSIALINGLGKAASLGYSDYDNGVFSLSNG